MRAYPSGLPTSDPKSTATKRNPFDKAKLGNGVQTYRDLVEAIAKGAILFVGAGSSCRVGYPGWGQLLDDVAQTVVAKNPAAEADMRAIKNVDVLIRASKYSSQMGATPFADYVAGRFAPRSPQFSEFHLDLVGLPFQHVITTNYDNVLEAAHQSARGTPAESLDFDGSADCQRFLSQCTQAGYDRRYLHLHGSAARPSSIVLTREHYNSLYIQNNLITLLSRGVFLVHRVVFIGFSMSDADFMQQLQELAGLLQLAAPRHFALLPRPPSEDLAQKEVIELREKHHVQVLHYDPANRHQELADLVAQLRVDVSEYQQNSPDRVNLTATEVIKELFVEVLADQPAARDLALERLPDSLTRRLPLLSQVTATASGLEPSALDREIDGVFKWVENGLPDAAIEKYREIEVRTGITLSNRIRYRLRANIGNALYSRGDKVGAAKAYREAVAFYRDSKEARAVEAHAFLLDNDLAKANELANSLCAEFPLYGRAQFLRLHSMPETTPFDELERSTPPDIRSDAEVAMALCEAAVHANLSEKEEEYARRAMAASPDWPDAINAVVQALIRSEQSTAILDLEHGLVASHPGRAEEAVALSSKAISMVPATDPMGRLGIFYYHRSVARRMLRQAPEAGVDVVEAFRRDPEETEICLSYSLDASTPEEVTKAIDALHRLSATEPSVPRIAFMLCWQLDHRNGKGDREEAESILRGWMPKIEQIQPVEYRSDFVRMLIKLLCDKKNFDGARNVLRECPASSLRPAIAATLAARVELRARNLPTAVELSTKALGLLDDSCSLIERRDVAIVAQDARLFSLALDQWKKMIPLDRATPDTERALQCAFFGGDPKYVLDLCTSLRSHGVEEQKYLQFEVEVLTQWRETDQAVALLQRWLKYHPDDRDAWLGLSVIGLNEDRPDLIESDPQKLPRVEDIDVAAKGAACALVLRHGIHPEIGVAYAYELWRRFPDDRAARRGLATAVIDPSLPPMELVTPEQIAAGCAVCVSKDSEKPHWIVIEDGPKPSVTRGEYPPDHPLAKALVGLRQGESASHATHEYRVHVILPKAVLRAREIMDNYEEQFPDEFFVRRFRVPDNYAEATTPEELLGEAWTVMKNRAEMQRQIEAHYQKEVTPVAIVARAFGKTVFETIRYLAATEGQSVRAGPSEFADFEKAVVAFREASTIVLDSTALATISILDLTGDVSALGKKLVVPKAARDEIRKASLEAARHTTGYLFVHNGRPQIHTPTTEQIAAEVTRLEALSKWIADNCEVVGGSATTELDAELREELPKIVGIASADAIAIAHKLKAPLWTDDFATGAVGVSQPFAIRPMWTEAVIFAALKSKAISATRFLDYKLRLVQAEYWFIRMNYVEIHALMRQLAWDMKGPGGRSLAKYLCEVAGDHVRNRHVVAMGLVMTGLSTKDLQVGCRRVVSVLEAMPSRTTANSIARHIYRQMRLAPSPRQRAFMALRRALRRWRGRTGEFRPTRKPSQS
jgi:tetratricopeptide (TPR) repeat protein